MPVTQIKKTSKDLPLTVIIPAAGKGVRRQSASLEQLPNGESLINYQLKTVRRAYKNCDIIVVIGHERRNILDTITESVRIVENENYLHTNTARSVQLALQICPQIGNILLIHGDVFFNEEAIKHLFGGMSCLVLDDLELQNENAVGIIQQNDRILQCTYKDFPKWGHIAYFDNKEAKILNSLLKTDLYEHCFSEELINKIIDEGGEFTTFSSPKTISVEMNRYDAKKCKTTHSGTTTNCHQ